MNPEPRNIHLLARDERRYPGVLVGVRNVLLRSGFNLLCQAASLRFERGMAVPLGEEHVIPVTHRVVACTSTLAVAPPEHSLSREKPAVSSGLHEERMMGLEPTTFCMASRPLVTLTPVRETAV